jgi:hypothetical protein
MSARSRTQRKTQRLPKTSARPESAKPKAARPGERKRLRKRMGDPRRGLVRIHQAEGKTVEEFTLSHQPDDHSIDIFFEDQTGVSFSYEPGITLTMGRVTADGDFRRVKKWPETGD